ncbi:50S ribosomal protein L13 [bacterium (Candidatus Gribaldobacteria) CG07_land_8_20_14_0_80_33_18]|uniref:Large ribosomal subunit protein uL13 n=1 Tax=bacterium (Candidatus Gribaldobacteria) CG07_land_8_20_14_0_80_33_18 TaxID=2014272 RepID=A0A2M6Z3H2_9BACT|nr:MAG: 50S ribosomal protein L13 [bacterium (Candidatus Gribaldobacteria) CG10_big_fil_rev_8_21_14_0_10_33_41]PIU46953.1 MAG: 50S ribosomal protein L13 [bacterium (Candidatus Gribaldobacteria) CG07_land_8_20_14_0_80_33_18]PJA00422.1 MAG: 50S ribosomal protein L13 [bacterium (Candidatus Gribaldobacteria) CG_4_10_14_0_2_um_filter_33_15]
MKRETRTIDATGKPLGRLACEITILLRGKQRSNFVPHLDGGDFVVVKNVDKIKLTGKKMEQKVYYKYSGYPGGLKKKSLAELFRIKPGLVLKKAVFGMLPKNKLRVKMIKCLQYAKN